MSGGFWLGRRFLELEHLCWDALALVAAAGSGGSQAREGTLTPAWPKVTPREGDGASAPQHMPGGDEARRELAAQEVAGYPRQLAARLASGPAGAHPSAPAGEETLAGTAQGPRSAPRRGSNPRTGRARAAKPHPSRALHQEGGGGRRCQQLPPLPDPKGRALLPRLLGRGEHGRGPEACQPHVGPGALLLAGWVTATQPRLEEARLPVSPSPLSPSP